MAPIPYNRMYLLDKPDIKPSHRPFIHVNCQSELTKLCPTTKQQSVLKVQLQKRMNFFADHISDFLDAPSLFEFYANYSDNGTPLPVYVMRFNRNKVIGNLRIFFVIRKDDMYMLHSFIEKGKKTYGPAYDVAKTRLS